MSLIAVGGNLSSVAGKLVSTGGTGIEFIPAGSQTFSGTIADGQAVTLTGTGFGTKPYAANPLLWAPMDTQLAPSALGRVATWSAPSGGLTFASTGGPTGLGCATGSGSPGPGGVNNGVSSWTLGFDIDSWSGWSSQYAINNYGQTLYVYRQIDRFLLPYLSDSNNYNTKNFRCWARTAGIGSSQAPPDFYAPIDDGRFAVEDITVDWSPGPDYNADPLALAAYENVTGWFSEEIQVISNSAAGNTDANYNWTAIAPGLTFGISNITKASSAVVTSNSVQSFNPFEQLGNNEQQLTFGGVGGMTQINGMIGRVTAAGGSIGAWTATVGINTSSFSTYTSGGTVGYVAWNFPNDSYQINSWKFLNSSNSGLTNAVNGEGNILRVYPCHYIVDGSPGSGRPSAPLGSYPQYAMTYVDDSWCRVVIQDTPTYIAATVREIQIPSAWSNTSISFTVRQGMFASLSGKYLFVVNAAGTPTLQGSFL